MLTRTRKNTRQHQAPKRRIKAGNGKPATKQAHDRGLPIIVAMGASAGGLEAFDKFFSRMATDSGLAFILVPHLDARHKSAMAELVQRYTSMPVVEIADKTKISPNHVYVIPPDATLTIKQGQLRLTKPRQQPLTVDPFLRSLAEDQGENAIAVILSGSGSDGTIGVRDIKEHGGLAIAQAGTSSRFAGMPHSAVATGLVDFVLAVEAMPAKLVEYAQHLRRLRSRKLDEEFRKGARQHLIKLATLLRSRTGHDFSRYKDRTFLRRVQRRMQVVQASSVSDYLAVLRQNPQEIDLLFRDLLIGVTQFFRDRPAFQALTNDVIPLLVKDKSPADELRIWVPACATGEEVYSLAILVREALNGAKMHPKVMIFGTDIDEDALQAARAGRYSESVSHDVSTERLNRFFVREGGGYRVSGEIREMCLFSPHNLIRDAPFSRLDMISCRNLLIYLDESLQNRVIPIFHFALRTGGFLFLGASENVSQHGKLFARLDGKFRIFKARPVNGLRPILDLPLQTASARAVAAPHAVALPKAEVSVSHRAARAMEAHAPAYVVLDEEHDIVHFSGRTGKYLQPSPGAASLNLFAILDKNLRPEVRAVLHKAARTGQRVVQKNVGLMEPGGLHAVNVIAEPLPENPGEPRYTILIFQEAGAVPPPDNISSSPEEKAEKVETFAYLENELQSTRERLQTSIEELEASNEELKASNEESQSVNEELQSANEELESSKEELQSVNEELETVNAELNSKIEGLERANNDRKNLLESTQIATLFLDNELHIRGFTPAVADIFHVIETDHGRPITDIATRLAYEPLEKDMRRVMRTLTAIEGEVALTDGSAIYIMRILPYRTTSDFIGGLVITFVDITARKRNEEDLARLAAIVESSRDAIIGMSADGTILTWNHGAELIYGYSAAEAVGRSLSLVIPADRPDELRMMIERAKRPRLGQLIETLREAKDGRRICVSSTVSPVRDPKGRIIALSAIERDISERKAAEEHQAMLLAELNHRVKNTLTTVLSLSTRTLRNSASLNDFQQTFEGRIRALAKTHDILAANNWAGAELETIVITALAPFRERGERMVVSGEKVILKASAALILAIMLHELTTNAVKYGALSSERGRIEVSWETDLRAKTLSIRWQERDGPKVGKPNRRKGFGMSLIERGMAHELRGNAAFDFRSAGLRCALEMPLAEVTAPVLPSIK